MTSRGRRSLLLVLLVGILGGGAYFLVRAFDEPNALTSAHQAIERRDFQTAGKLLEQHLSAYPKDLDARMSAVQTARRRGDFDTALRHLRVYEQQSGPPDAARLEHQLLALQQGYLAETSPLLAYCVAHPDAAETPLLLEAVIVGNLNVLAQPYWEHTPLPPNADVPPLTHARRAIELWLQARTGLADRVQGLAWRGRARELGADHAGAVADLRAALELNPEHYESRMHLALFINQETPRESMTHFNVLAQRYPDDLLVQRALASGHRGFGQLDDARAILDKILAAHPTDVPALIERGLVELDAVRPAQAEGWFRRALVQAPQMPVVHQSLGRCMQLQGRTAEAKQYLVRFEELEAEQKKRMKDGQSTPPAKP